MDTKSLRFQHTIEKWDEALPLGNGDIGCLIWNSSDQLRFSLDKGGIWDCSNPPEAQKDFTYGNIQKLVQLKKKKALRKKYDDCYGNTTPTKLPAGKLILDLGVQENIVSHLDFQSAQATLQLGDLRLKTFVHAVNPFGLIEINKTGVGMTVDNPKYGGRRKPLFQTPFRGTVQSLKNLRYPDASFVTEEEDGILYQYFIQPTNDRFYGIIAAKKEHNGVTLIAYTVCVNEKRNFIQHGKEMLKSALCKGYDAAFETHTAWWKQYWNKSSVSLPDKFLEKQWYLNNYLLGSCSRKGFFPMPLQGVWTADNGSLPPWKGDYHHDLNTQMSYTSYLKANRLEQGECFIDYLLAMSDAARKFARNFYNAAGLCLPSVMDIEGHALGGWCQYALSPTNQLWLCNIMARYYFFTKDGSYLNKIYSYMRETGTFLLDILQEQNGFYKLPLSTSPEIHDNSLEAWLTPNTNYDLALMRAFMEHMIKLSDETGNHKGALEWEKHLNKLEPLSVNENNVLMLSPDESLTVSHRHHSHCLSIYPLKTLRYDTAKNRGIIDSTIHNLEVLGQRNWVGYSVAWIAELYIAQKNGNKARDMLHDFFHYYCTDNGFHVNGDFKRETNFVMKYRLFTLEGNFLATDAIQDMLLYSENGVITLFPAIPSEWKNISFENFRAFGGLLISCVMEEGEITFLKIQTTADCSFKVTNDLSHLHPNTTVDSNTAITSKKNECFLFS